MSKLKIIRELQNLTQEELSEKSGISVRTIQRIESGRDPKGYTLRILAETLGIQEKELLNKVIETNIETVTHEEQTPIIDETFSVDYSKIKLINLSSLPFIILPLFNILVPLALTFIMKVKTPLTKQIISLQILWTIVAPIIFMVGILLRIGNKFTLVLMTLLILSNIYIIVRNAVEIAERKKLRYKLNFNII